MKNTEGKFKLKQVEVRLKLVKRRPLYANKEIVSPGDAVAVMADAMAEFDREHLCVVNLDVAGHPLNFSVVSIGDVKNSLVSMQSLYKSSILSNASRILALHNHPSGSIAPTKLDVEVTKRMIEAGKIMNIPLVDHIIVGAYTGDYYSFLSNQPELFQESAENKRICAEGENQGNQLMQK